MWIGIKEERTLLIALVYIKRNGALFHLFDLHQKSLCYVPKRIFSVHVYFSGPDLR